MLASNSGGRDAQVVDRWPARASRRRRRSKSWSICAMSVFSRRAAQSVRTMVSGDRMCQKCKCMLWCATNTLCAATTAKSRRTSGCKTLALRACRERGVSPPGATPTSPSTVTSTSLSRASSSGCRRGPPTTECDAIRHDSVTPHHD